MKYHIDFQYMGKNQARPSDDGEVMPITIAAGEDPSVIPVVGDFVQIISGAKHAPIFDRTAAVG